MAKRSRKKKKEAVEETDAEEAASDEEIDAEEADEGDGEQREGDDRRRGDRRKGGRRKGDLLHALRRIGLAVWVFAFFSLLVGFYGGYTVWSEFAAPLIGDGIPPLSTMRQTNTRRAAPNSFTIQFQSFRVRSTIGGDSVRVAITPYVETRYEAELAALCENHTAVQFAIRQVLDRQFRSDKGAETDYQAVSDEMRDEINKVLSARLVTGVRIVRWKPPQSAAATATDGAPPRVCGGFGR